jgi:DNA-binding PadR family transcriptional regulator
MPVAEARRVNRGPQAMLPLTPAMFHILLTLSAGPLHGYRIMQEVDRLSGGSVRLGQGTLYRSTQRMVTDELIEEIGSNPKDESFDARRRTYRPTPYGTAVARAEAERLRSLVDAAEDHGLLNTRMKRGSGSRRRP